MTGYVGPIETQTLKNAYFRQVLFTGKPPNHADGTVHKTKAEAEAAEAAAHHP